MKKIQLGKRKENVLIIGASGFVGKALTAKLLGKNNNLTLLSRDRTFKSSGAKVFHGDLLDRELCAKIIQDIDIVYYVAGFKKNFSVHTKVPFDSLSGNTLPFLNFLEAAKDSSIRKIVYVSSVIVDYALLPSPWIDGYVWGKYINEFIARSFSAQTKIDIAIVRPAAIYGPGNDFDSRTSNLIASFIAKVADGSEELALHGDGSRKLQFVYIDDFVKNLVAIGKNKNVLFSIGNKEVISVKNVVSRIMKIMRKDLQIRYNEKISDKPTKLVQFNNLVEPTTGLEVGLRKTVVYYLDKKS